MKFAVCSLVIGDQYKKTVAACTASQEAHAKKHGYDRITDESIVCRARDYTWSKIPLIQKYLPKYDFIMWIDGDVMITNQERKLEDFIHLLAENKFLLIGRDFQGLNAGVFIIRNCHRAFEFLERVWKRDDMSRKLFHEQTAMSDLLATEKFKGSARIIPHAHINIMNAYDYRMDQKVYWRPGDFCIHFAGLKDQNLANLQDMYSRFWSTDPSGTYRFEKYKNQMLVDTFLFYNEIDLLELRLSLLDDYVDLFVIVESEVTFMGTKKDLFFEKNKDRFKKWLPKIEHVILTEDETPVSSDQRAQKRAQRGDHYVE